MATGPSGERYPLSDVLASLYHALMNGAPSAMHWADVALKNGCTQHVITNLVYFTLNEAGVELNLLDSLYELYFNPMRHIIDDNGHVLSFDTLHVVDQLRRAPKSHCLFTAMINAHMGLLLGQTQAIVDPLTAMVTMIHTIPVDFASAMRNLVCVLLHARYNIRAPLVAQLWVVLTDHARVYKPEALRVITLLQRLSTCSSQEFMTMAFTHVLAMLCTVPDAPFYLYNLPPTKICALPADYPKPTAIPDAVLSAPNHRWPPLVNEPIKDTWFGARTQMFNMAKEKWGVRLVGFTQVVVQLYQKMRCPVVVRPIPVAPAAVAPAIAATVIMQLPTVDLADAAHALLSLTHNDERPTKRARRAVRFEEDE